MSYQPIIQSQYLAALAMLEQAVVRCPDELWDNEEDKGKFWHVAYHVLFYTHLYLQKTEHDFQPWARHRPDYEQMGPPPWAPDQQPEIGEPYPKADVLEYLAFCRKEVAIHTAELNLDAPSGFEWLPFTKFELQIYSIRHLQQHVGELMERLGRRAGVDVDWVGKA